MERRIGALGKLPAEVRWHFNMKLGLCGDMSEALPAPFDKISGELFEPLAQGFGDRVAIQVFANPQRPVVDKWKYDDGSAAELQELANTLMARL